MVKSLKSTRTYTLAEIEARLRSDGFNEKEANKVVTTLEPKLMTIDEAAESHGLNRETVRKWVQRGHLTRIAIRPGSGRGGGSIVIDVAELDEFLNNRRGPGRPPKDN